MKTQIIALEAHDDFISVRDRMSWAKSPRILLVWPKFEKITLRAADLRILQQHASYLGAELGVVTKRGEVRRDAERFGIPVFGSATAAQREAWSPRKPVDRPELRRRRERAELEAMKEAAHVGEAPWRSRPVTRFISFILGVLAVLVVAGIFLPQARVTITPVSTQQDIELPVTASRSVSSVSLAGGVPAHQVTIAANASQSARVLTESAVPDSKARGIARFTNLTQSDVTIPAGTVVYSLAPTAAQFVTLNDTHLPGNVNAIVEVPIEALKAGGEANVPANAIQAIDGNLSLSAAVSNPKPTEGGSNRMAAAPSDADRTRLRDVVLDILKTQAEAQISETIGPRDLMLPVTLKMGRVQEETYDPPVGQPGNLLKLTMRVDFSAEYVKAQDLDQLAEATLNAAMPLGFTPVADTMAERIVAAPTVDATGAVHFKVQLGRRLSQEVDLQRVNALVRGRTPEHAAQALQAALPLAQAPGITLVPAWWPWLPLVPFRITVASVP